jgi:hypothetical protein
MVARGRMRMRASSYILSGPMLYLQPLVGLSFDRRVLDAAQREGLDRPIPCFPQAIDHRRLEKALTLYAQQGRDTQRICADDPSASVCAR